MGTTDRKQAVVSAVELVLLREQCHTGGEDHGEVVAPDEKRTDLFTHTHARTHSNLIVFLSKSRG